MRGREVLEKDGISCGTEGEGLGAGIVPGEGGLIIQS